MITEPVDLVLAANFWVGVGVAEAGMVHIVASIAAVTAPTVRVFRIG
jgi:hypothetical protein